MILHPFFGWHTRFLAALSLSTAVDNRHIESALHLCGCQTCYVCQGTASHRPASPEAAPASHRVT